jgi:hypothetical protein
MPSSMTYLEFLQISYCPHFFRRYGVSPTRVDWIPWPKFSLDCLFSIEPLEFLGMSASAKIVSLYGTHSYDTTSSRFLSQVSSTLCEMIFKSGYDWELCSVTLPKLEMLKNTTDPKDSAILWDNSPGPLKMPALRTVSVTAPARWMNSLITNFASQWSRRNLVLRSTNGSRKLNTKAARLLVYKDRPSL